jgi:hypothetical protein
MSSSINYKLWTDFLTLIEDAARCLPHNEGEAISPGKGNEVVEDGKDS